MFLNKTLTTHSLIIISLILVSLIVRIIYNPLRSTGNLYPDEAYYLVNSKNIANIASNPILICRAVPLLTYFLVYYLFGFSLDIFIWVNYLYGVSLTIVTYLMVLDITRSILKSLLSSISITLSSFFILASQSNLIDLPIAFWLVVLYYFLYKTHYDKRYILPSILTALICLFTKETAFYAVPILILTNIGFIKNYKKRLLSLILLIVVIGATGFLITKYLEMRRYFNLLSIENAEQFIINLGSIIITNFYLLISLGNWSYEKYLTIVTCIVFIFILLKVWRNKRIEFFEISLFFYSMLFYLILLYVNPAKVALNIGWRYLLPAYFGIIVLFSVLIADSIIVVNSKIQKIKNNMSSIIKNKRELRTVVLIILLSTTIISLPVYYSISELNFYNRYVNLTIYEYDSLRMASLIVKDLKQDNESSILTPFIYQVNIWTEFKFKEYYSFPKNESTLFTLLNETKLDYIIVSEWWGYHPFEVIEGKYMLVCSVTDIANRTTKIYKSN